MTKVILTAVMGVLLGGQFAAAARPASEMAGGYRSSSGDLIYLEPNEDKTFPFHLYWGDPSSGKLHQVPITDLKTHGSAHDGDEWTAQFLAPGSNETHRLVMKGDKIFFLGNKPNLGTAESRMGQFSSGSRPYSIGGSPGQVPFSDALATFNRISPESNLRLASALGRQTLRLEQAPSNSRLLAAGTLAAGVNFAVTRPLYNYNVNKVSVPHYLLENAQSKYRVFIGPSGNMREVPVTSFDIGRNNAKFTLDDQVYKQLLVGDANTILTGKLGAGKFDTASEKNIDAEKTIWLDSRYDNSTHALFSQEDLKQPNVSKGSWETGVESFSPRLAAQSCMSAF